MRRRTVPQKGANYIRDAIARYGGATSVARHSNATSAARARAHDNVHAFGLDAGRQPRQPEHLDVAARNVRELPGDDIVEMMMRRGVRGVDDACRIDDQLANVLLLQEQAQ